MSTTETLRIQLDNVQCELQLLQVENKKLRTEASEDGEREEMGKEIEELRQRLLENEERVITAEQEVGEWKTSVELLQGKLAEAKQSGDVTVKSLIDQLTSSNRVVEQLTKESSEQQLELNSLRAQNKLLTQSQSRMTEPLCTQVTERSVNEASLRSVKDVHVSGYPLPQLELSSEADKVRSLGSHYPRSSGVLVVVQG